jgi:VirE-like protein
MTSINLFRDSFHPTPLKSLSVCEGVAMIRAGVYRQEIERLIRVRAQGDAAAYRQAKERLPALTFGGTFHPSRSIKHLVQHSGLVHADLDHLPDVAALKQTLCQDSHVIYCFVSPSREGLKLGVRIDPVADDAAYKHAWSAVAADHFDRYGVAWDPSGKDICRLCYVSWDPDCYVNLQAQVFPVPIMVAPPPKPVRPRPVTRFADDHRTRFAQRAITVAIRMIEEAPEHHQHHARLRAARLLGGYIAGGLLTYDEAYHALRVSTESQAKNVAAAMKTIADGLAYGETMPITFDELEAEYQAWQARRRPSLSHRTLTPTAPHRQLATQPQGRTLAGEDTQS